MDFSSDASALVGTPELTDATMSAVADTSKTVLNESHHDMSITSPEIFSKTTFKGNIIMPKQDETQLGIELSVIEGMHDQKVNQTAYWSFGHSFQLELVGVDKTMEQDLLSALKWFRMVYAEFPAHGPWNLYVRIYLFQVLKNVLQEVKAALPRPKNSEQIQKQILNCLGMESLNEMILTMMVDVTTWLNMHQGKMMLDSDNESSALEYFITSWEDILEMPFVKPDTFAVNHISSVLNNLRSRTDMFSIISNTLDHLFNRVKWIRNQGVPNPQEDIGLVSLKKKIEWILLFVDETLRRTPPSVSSANGIVEICIRILSEPDEDPFSGLLDAARELKFNLSAFVESSCPNRQEMPPMAFLEKQIPYVYEMLNLKKKLFKENNIIGPEVSKVSDSTESLNLGSPTDQLLVRIDGILFQVDPVAERLVNFGNEKAAQSAIFISPYAGRFIVSKLEVLFLGQPINTPAYDYDPLSLSLAIKIAQSDIKILCKAGIESDGLNVAEEEAPEEKFSRRKSVSSIMRRRSKASMIKKPKKKAASIGGNQAILIGTSSEVYKFFPFAFAEADTVVKHLSEISGVIPISLADYKTRIANSIKSRDGVVALQVLSKESNPWIETTEELTKCIMSLTRESTDFSFITLERLYHSCRLEKKVTFETISCLKEVMSTLSSETAMLKTLMIVDRILDKSVMTPGDDLFSFILLWLKECQDTISPFKNPIAGKALDNLLRRCKSFSIEPLVPLGENTEFDYQFDYEYWLMSLGLRGVWVTVGWSEFECEGAFVAPQKNIEMIEETTEPLIVIPPPEIRKVLDKTAHFVARNGPSFEERIKENEKMNNKFAFLNQNDPYRPYYDKRVKEFKEGTADIKPKTNVAQAPTVAPVPIVKPPPKEPKGLSFLIDTPPIPIIDYELIKLTALFVARNGRSFMNSLAKKEVRNFQFDFLKSNHALFGHFTRLVEMYAKILNPKKEILIELERFVDSKFNALEDIYGRVAYQRHQEETVRKEQERVEEEKVAFASIDWHDFVVVETIEFTVADAESNLPMPMTLKALENLNIIKKKANIVFEEIEPGEDVMELDSPKPSAPKGPPPQAPAVPVPEPVSREDAVTTTKKIRTDYVPKVGKIGVAEPTQICPRCGIAVKVSEMEEHVRIELLDPKWRQQKSVYESRLKDSNLILGKQDISKNLSRLSDHRSDIFGSEGSEDSKKLIEKEKKISAEKLKGTWDGKASSAPKALKNAQSNVPSAPEKTIGPQIPPIPGSKIIPPIPKIPKIPPLPGIIRPPSLPTNIPPPPKPIAPSSNGGSVHPSKKQKQDEPPPEGLLLESVFLSKYSGPVNLNIISLDGSYINLDGLELTSTVNSIKEKIASKLGIAASKLKLVTSSGIAMRNAMTLAYYNLVTGSMLSLAKK